MNLIRVFLVFSALFIFCTAGAQKGKEMQVTPARILLIFDASNSMKTAYEGQTRIEAAKKLLFRIMDSLQRIPNLELALRIYGSEKSYPPGDCNDSHLVVPFAKANAARIREKVIPLKPTGITPIAHSLTLAADDFPRSAGTNIILLITDGIEECGGDPCEAARKLREKGIVFKPYILGIGLSQAQSKTFECVGTYFSAEEPNALVNVVGVVVTQTMNRTTVQVNLIDQAGNPTETNVNMSFYDHFSGNLRYDYIHTMNSSGNPDTLTLDASPSYHLVVHTIPPVEKDNIKLLMGRHNIIALDAPQGKLELRRPNGTYNFNYRIKCLVRKRGGSSILNVQDLNSEEKYLVGVYDLEILTLPRTYLSDVQLEQSHTTSLDILPAGELKLMTGETGSGSIYVEEHGDMRWICNLDNSQTIQNYYLQPGKYRVEFRARNKRESAYTLEKRFTIEADKSLTVSLY
jgi:Ca-activated chloride channel family protein